MRSKFSIIAAGPSLPKACRPFFELSPQENPVICIIFMNILASMKSFFKCRWGEPGLELLLGCIYGRASVM
jgi:hypothetical protein